MNSRRITERSLSKTDFTDPLGGSSSPGAIERVIILVPGIRTNADWVDEVTSRLETFSEPVKAYKAYGGRISLIHLLTRFGVNKIRSDIKNQIASIIQAHAGCEVSLVCHSMGTDIIADILIEEMDYPFKYIIFLGSICSRRKAISIKKSCECFINHRGSYDQWPLIAAIARPCHYEYTGVFGFNKAAWVNEVVFDNNHSSCTDVKHVMDFVIPIIMGLKQLRPNKVSNPFDINTHFYIKWFTYMLVAGGLAGTLVSVYLCGLAVLGCAFPLLFYGVGRKAS